MVMSYGQNNRNFPGLDRIFPEGKIRRIRRKILLAHLHMLHFDKVYKQSHQCPLSLSIVFEWFGVNQHLVTLFSSGQYSSEHKIWEIGMIQWQQVS